MTTLLLLVIMFFAALVIGLLAMALFGAQR